MASSTKSYLTVFSSDNLDARFEDRWVNNIAQEIHMYPTSAARVNTDYIKQLSYGIGDT